jgi:hypothetical protein
LRAAFSFPALDQSCFVPQRSRIRDPKVHHARHESGNRAFLVPIEIEPFRHRFTRMPRACSGSCSRRRARKQQDPNATSADAKRRGDLLVRFTFDVRQPQQRTLARLQLGKICATAPSFS